MKVIHKYTLELGDRVTMALPKEAEILSVQWQDNRGLRLWAIVDKESLEFEYRIFRIYGTGDFINERENLKHITTVQQPTSGSPLVWHIFEVMSS